MVIEVRKMGVLAAVTVGLTGGMAVGDPADDLYKKAVEAGRAAETYHIREGLLIPTRIEVVEGPKVYDATSQEDVCTRTGEYLFALCFEYLTTKDKAAYERARRTAAALLKLEKVTGVPGVVARVFKKADKPTIDEHSFFFPLEWHQSDSMPGYRWMGDLSVDQLNDWMIGLSLYHDLLATGQDKKRVADAIDRVGSRLLKHDLKIVDYDGKMTLWGNMSPSLPHEHLNALFGLSNIKIAWQVTKKEKYARYWEELITKHKYHEEIVLAKVLYPEFAVNRSDDNLAMEALYSLMRLETDESLRQYYRICFERHWQLLKDENVTLYDFFREVYWLGEGSIDDKTLDYLKRYKWQRTMQTAHFRTEQGPAKVKGWFSEAPYTYLRTYWFGRYHGLVPAPGGAAAPAPVKKQQVAPKPSAGMVYVPAGKFIMGSIHGDNDEKPQHVAETKAFFVDRYEVTNEQYVKFDANHKFDPKRATCPAIVTWEQANAYASWAGKRLPTETEWEKAARGTDGRRFPWGSIYEVHLGPWDDAQPVGSVKTDVSPYGCYDMAGNVWEWTADWYKPYASNDMPSPSYGEKFKVIRGGAAFNDGAMMRCSHRYYMKPNTNVPGHRIGFRCVKDVE